MYDMIERMNFWSKDLGNLSAGAIVEVSLSGNAANVMLLDSSNLANYKTRRPFQYVGGHIRRSPARLATPNAGHWHVVIDYGGAAGRGTASVRMIRG